MFKPGLTMVARVADAVGRGPNSWRAAHAAEGPRGPAPELDLDFLARQTFGDPGLEAELLRLFDVQAEQALARLAAPYSADENTRRANFAHAIKGSARAIGAAATATAAAEYEAALRAGRPDVEASRARLASALTAARIALAARLDPEGG